MKKDDIIPLRWGTGNVDWQQRINWEELRKKRMERAQKFMAKWGIGSAIIYNHDRRRYLSSVWTHPYGKHLPYNFVLFVRDAGFPYVPVEEHVDGPRVIEDCPWLKGRIVNEHELLQPKPVASGMDPLIKNEVNVKILHCRIE